MPVCMLDMCVGMLDLTMTWLCAWWKPQVRLQANCLPTNNKNEYDACGSVYVVMHYAAACWRF